MISQTQLSLMNEYGSMENLITNDSSTGQVDEEGRTILDYSSSNYIRDLFGQKMKVIGKCDAGDNCLEQVYTLNGNLRGTYRDPSLILSDGTILLFGWTYKTTCSKTSACTEIGVVLNSRKNKDRYVLGKDLFYFSLYSDRVLPKESLDIRYLENNCLKPTSQGYSCAAWVINKENMDYLHCKDLSWDGKDKCK